MTKCSYADEYKATRRPICGCDYCAEKWEAKIRAERDHLWATMLIDSSNAASENGYSEQAEGINDMITMAVDSGLITNEALERAEEDGVYAFWNGGEVAEAQMETDRWKSIALHLADCHAANETTVIRRTMPRYELERFISICESTARFLEGERPPRTSRVAQDVIDRLKQNASSARAALAQRSASSKPEAS